MIKPYATWLARERSSKVCACFLSLTSNELFTLLFSHIPAFHGYGPDGDRRGTPPRIGLGL